MSLVNARVILNLVVMLDSVRIASGSAQVLIEFVNAPGDLVDKIVKAPDIRIARLISKTWPAHVEFFGRMPEQFLDRSPEIGDTQCAWEKQQLGRGGRTMAGFVFRNISGKVRVTGRVTASWRWLHGDQTCLPEHAKGALLSFASMAHLLFFQGHTFA